MPNADNALLPGMYAQVELSSVRGNPPLLVPSDALIVRADGAQVAVVRPDHTVHLQKIEVGRDYGDRLEVLSGLQRRRHHCLQSRRRGARRRQSRHRPRRRDGKVKAPLATPEATNAPHHMVTWRSDILLVPR